MNEYFGRSSTFIARASSFGESCAFGGQATGCVVVGEGAVGGDANKDDTGSRGAVSGVNRDGAGSEVDVV